VYHLPAAKKKAPAVTPEPVEICNQMEGTFNF
jgi:hypothetical protein